MTKPSFPLLALLGTSLVFGGCGVVLGLDDYTQDTSSSSTGNAGQGGTGGGTGGSAGMGGATECTPGTMQPCYSGLMGTQDVGLCKAGQQTCLGNGTGFGACEGEVIPAAESCSTTGDEDCNGSSCSETAWARIFGDGAMQYGRVVAADGKGGVYVAGTMDGTLNFDNDSLIGAGGTDIFLAHLEADGSYDWSLRVGDGQDQIPTAMTVDAAGNVYLAGIVVGIVDFGGGPLPALGSNDIAIASFTPTGAHRWSRRYGASASQEPTGLALTPDGGLIVVGSFGLAFDIGATTLTSAGDWDVFVAKLDQATGNEVWAKRFGSTKAELAGAVAVDASGGIILVGRYFGPVGFGGMVLPLSNTVGDNNVFALKLDSNGNHVWSDGYGDDSGFQWANSVVVDKEGSVIFAGDFQGSMNFGGATFIAPNSYHDVYVVKLTSSGTHVWSKAFGGVFDDRSARLAQSSTGDLFLSCYFTDSIDFGGTSLLSDGSFDIAVARFTADGAHVWSRRFGGAPNDTMQQITGDIAWSPDGRSLFVTGSQMGTTDYGKGPLNSAGGFDALVMAIGP